jgi:hypothetical protein
MSLSRRSKVCRSVWLRRQRRSRTRMSSFKRRKSFILSSRTYWRSRVDQRSLRSFRFISRIWRREPSSWRTWLLNLRTTRRRWMPTDSRMSALISRFQT